MDFLDQEKIEDEVEKTISGLAEREDNKISFTDWPKILSTEYDLKPKKRRVKGGQSTSK
jgi:hypothetical protein